MINTIILACDRHPQPQSELGDLEIISFVLSIYFTIEMGLKIAGEGTWG